jgi:hypothetical protein
LSVRRPQFAADSMRLWIQISVNFPIGDDPDGMARLPGSDFRPETRLQDRRVIH